MKRTLSKLLTWLLVVAMVASMGFTALAEEPEAAAEPEEVEAVAEAPAEEPAAEEPAGPSITAQPENVAAAEGETAVFTVETDGEVRRCQWETSADGENWSVLSSRYYGNKTTLNIPATEDFAGVLFRAVVTLKDGTILTSEAASLTLEEIAMPAQVFDGGNGDVAVSIDAPEGAFPEGTEMTVEEVSVADAQALVDADASISGKVVAAADISFFYEGEDIQPGEPVTVNFTSDAVKGKDNLVVYHVGENGLEPVDLTEVAAEEPLRGEPAQDTVAFTADGFSIYVVLEPGEEGAEASATVNFWSVKKNSAGTAYEPYIVASFYIKNSDVLLKDNDNDGDIDDDDRLPFEESYLEDIVTDPGAGDLGEDLLFRGWSVDDLMHPTAEAIAAAKQAGTPLPTYEENPDIYVAAGTSYAGEDYDEKTEVLNIEGVRKYLFEKVIGSIKEGDVVNVYAAAFKYFDITYFGDDVDGNPYWNVSYGSDTILLKPNETSAAYTVSMPYSSTSNQNFKGWTPTLEAVTVREDPANPESAVIATYPKTVDNITPATGVTLEEENTYPNDTEVILTGSVIFNVNAPHGNWLIYNANGKGATFNAPQFYLPLEETECAINAQEENMKRVGYTFGGWYYGKEETYIDDNDTPDDTSDDEEKTRWVIDETRPFTFGNVIQGNTNIFAKWNEVEEAPYTIILWTQNSDRTAYDVAGSYIGRGRVHTAIPVNFVDNTDEDYITGVGNNQGHYTGFTLNHSGTNVLGDLQKTTGYTTGNNPQPIKETVVIPTITPEGDAVLNVYFDRIVYNLKFYLYRQAANNNGTYNANGQRSYATRSGNGTNVWNIATSWTNVSAANAPSIDSTRFTIAHDETGQRENINQQNSTVYYGHYITLSAYYGEDIQTKWPTYNEIKGPNNDGTKAVSFVMMNGTGLKGNAYTGNGYGDGRDTIKGVITVMDDQILGQTQDANGNYLIIRYASYNNWTYHAYYEAVPGTVPEDPAEAEAAGYVRKTINGQTKWYKFDHDIESRSSNTYPGQQNPPAYVGFQVAKNADGTEYYDGFGPAGTPQANTSGYDVYLNYYYNREIYNITYMDGVYSDGRGNFIQTRATELLEENDEQIAQGAEIPDNYKNYTPDLPAGEEGYVFEGWFIDEGCTKEYTFTSMPVGGITVHAKWRQVQYRVFLHPNADLPVDEGEDPRDYSLSWGDETASDDDKQQMNFRVSWGDKISLPEGTRAKYEFVGWFKEDGSLYMEGTELNDTTVPATPEYDKTKDMTDIMDKFGYVITEGTYWISNQQKTVPQDYEGPSNSDAEREWITRKLDLYGHWRKLAEGSEGVNVVYTAVQDEDNKGHFEADGNPTTYKDPLFYVDGAKAIGTGAAIPDDPGEGESAKQFLYWVVQKWVLKGEQPMDGTEPEGEYVDLLDENGDPVICYPGDGFTVQLDYAKAIISKTHNDAQTGELVIDEATYTMQLRAEYGLSEVTADTFFDWYRNFDEDQYTANGLLRREDGKGEDDDVGLQINEHVDIYTIKAGIPTRPGYKFLGWEKDFEYEIKRDEGGNAEYENGEPVLIQQKDAEGNPLVDENNEPIYVIAYHDYSELDPDDIDIRWVEETEDDEGNTIEAHYEAKRSDGTWKTVTQTAADELLPYQAWFAVWEAEYFYIYHSSSKNLEAVPLDEVNEEGKYDLTSKVEDNTLYGGWYTSCGGTTEEKVKETFAAAVTADDLKAEVDGAEAYDGKYLKNQTSGTRFWTLDTAGDVKGTEVEPKANDVFYLKEVPVCYLKTNARWVYDWADGNKIQSMYLLTGIDESLYNDVGFVIQKENNSAKVVSSFSYQQRNSDTVTKIKAADLIGQRGYLGIVTATDLIDTLKGGTRVSIMPYWVTPDGVQVETKGYTLFCNEEGAENLTTDNLKYEANS